MTEEHTAATSESKRKISSIKPDGPIVKRQKNTTSDPAYRKHANFWIPNGNVLLQLGDVRFKLHRSRLEAQSRWFQRLFDRGAGLDVVDVEDADGYPDLTIVKIEKADRHLLYHIQPIVDLVDFEILLDAMDNGISYHHQVLSFPRLSAIFRAAKKLHFPLLSDYAARSLESVFSDNLDKLSTETIPYAAQAVILGRHWDLPRVLKRAFYELARTPVLSEEDTDHENPSANTNIDSVGIYSLPPKDLVRLSNVQKKLCSAWYAIASLESHSCPSCLYLVPVEDYELETRSIRNNRRHTTYTTPPPPPTRPCKSRKHTLLWETKDGLSLFKKYELDPLCGIKVLLLLDWKGRGYCEMCETFIPDSLKKQMEKIWDDMGTWLGL